MVGHFYAWTPLVIVGTVVLLSVPWLALFALMFFVLAALVALAALASAIVAVPYILGRAISRQLRERNGANRPSVALSLAERKTA